MIWILFILTQPDGRIAYDRYKTAVECMENGERLRAHGYDIDGCERVEHFNGRHWVPDTEVTDGVVSDEEK